MKSLSTSPSILCVQRVISTFPQASRISGWDFKEGEIYYLGELKISFLTQRFLFGFLPQKSVIEKLWLTGVEWKDKWKDTEQVLKKQQAWFPSQKNQNLTVVKSWKYNQKELPKKLEDAKKRNEYKFQKIT